MTTFGSRASSTKTAELEKNILYLIQAFIFNRPVQIKWRGVTSDGTLISCLPQGSIISHFLFNAYIQDFFKELPPDAYRFVYAYDISVIIPGSSTENCISNINSTLERLAQWSAKWKIVLPPGSFTQKN